MDGVADWAFRELCYAMGAELAVGVYDGAAADQQGELVMVLDGRSAVIESIEQSTEGKVMRAGGVEADNTPELREIPVAPTTDYDECLACQ